MDSKSTEVAKLRLVLLPLLMGMLGSVNAHPGGLNAEGCHNNRKTGDYHCHGGGRAVAAPPQHAMQSDFTAKTYESSNKGAGIV
jgi:hypothetical protein